MRNFLTLISLSVVAASWFGSDTPPPYSTWSASELKAWLVEHNFPVPTQSGTEATWLESLQSTVESNWNSASTWSQDQYTNAQKTFASVRDDSFETWDESKLRSWLLEQGIVAPKSKKEELVVMAKKQYKDYMAAAQQWSDWAANSASGSYETLTSYAAAATSEVEQTLDDTKDYVYSTWDDNRLRSFLEEKGVLKTKQQAKRDELLKMMRENYAAVTQPVWNAWATSYIHSWLVNHNLVAPTPTATEKARKALVDKMNQYYYTVNSYVWDTWNENELRTWIVDNGVAAQKEIKNLSRENLVKMVSNSYSTAASTVTSTWTDSQIREWLVKHDYIAISDSEKLKRGDLIKLFKEKLPQSKDPLSYTPQSYITWPTSRLRAYLVEAGVKENNLPTNREDLLQRVNEVWNGAKPNSQAWSDSLKGYVSGIVHKVEDVFTGASDKYSEGVDKANAKEDEIKADARKVAADALGKGEKNFATAKAKVEGEL
ncbi:hypothetical protein C8J56DRAFT_139800 [Mycena floridula]|nr:hypothetical protein C8J56DRAFT_139800 [Mycena floridula]